MAPFMMVDEKFTEGNIEILRRYSEELKDRKEDLILSHGDQMTTSRQRSAQSLLVNERGREERLQNFRPTPGLFHFKWKFLKTIFRGWWGNQEKVGTLAHARPVLGRSNKVDMDAKHFNHAHELLEDCCQANLLALWWKKFQLSPRGPIGMEKRVPLFCFLTPSYFSFFFFLSFLATREKGILPHKGRRAS